MSDSIWDTITDAVAAAAPVLGAALGPGGAAVGAMIADALGTENEPEAIAQALKTDPEAAIKLRKLQQEHIRELRSMTLQAGTTRLSEINQTMRAELKADNLFKSGWRPAIGWVLAFAMGAILSALAYAIYRDPSSAPEVIESATSIIWSMMIILGVAVKKRSDDKGIAQGIAPRGLGDLLASFKGK